MSSVSILINNYNYGHFVAAAIDSALAQRHLPLEVVVVDDGSSDDSRQVIEGFGARVVPVFKANGGHGSTFNAGLAHARGEVICLLDADDVFEPEKLTRVMEAFAQHPEAGWCFHTVRMVAFPSGETVGFSRQKETGVYDLRADLQRGRLPFSPPPTSGLTFRRSLLEQFFPIPEAAHTLISDRFVCYAALALAPGVFLEEPLTQLRLHGANDLTLQEGSDKIDLKAKKDLFNAAALRRHLPLLRRYANRLFARGWSLYRRFGMPDEAFDRLIDAYLAGATPFERAALPWWARLYDAVGKRPQRQP